MFGFRRRSSDTRQAETRPDGPAPRIPAGQRIYAVGDVHGRLDLLDRLLARIAEDIEAAPKLAHTLVMLGDYVDRGLESAGVIERLSAPPPPGIGLVCLKGNHEEVMLRFLDDLSVGPGWMRFGGLAALASYGVRRPDGLSEEEWLQLAQEELRRRLPPHHLAFLRHLRLHLAVGDYLFVHAGVRPGVPLADQTAEDLLWIRDDFLKSEAELGHVVVHGHTVSTAPEFRRNRIGIDTGAFASGLLTCLVLEGEERRIITT
ncbi:MAG TPA: metallophosphoesterase family protein [Azospirillaceae bacterium]|nr:metallophosphoesterase family protein [Azospirillaceae bacterium]